MFREYHPLRMQARKTYLTLRCGLTHTFTISLGSKRQGTSHANAPIFCQSSYKKRRKKRISALLSLFIVARNYKYFSGACHNKSATLRTKQPAPSAWNSVHCVRQCFPFITAVTSNNCLSSTWIYRFTENTTLCSPIVFKQWWTMFWTSERKKKKKERNHLKTFKRYSKGAKEEGNKKVF